MNACKHTRSGRLLLLLLFLLLAPASSQTPPKKVTEAYVKSEVLIPMRDGARLFTAIYAPRDMSRKYPFLLTRTPYGIAPYGAGYYREQLGPSPQFEKEGFIFVYQDARGRNKSEGTFQQVRPHLPVKRGPADVDESTDTYDTIEWLLKNIPNNNGRAGMIGISQPGFHVAAGMIDTHPALVAASPQAPTADYYLGDDDYHNGAFMLGANFGFYSAFLPRPGGPELPRIRKPFNMGTPDAYEFFLQMGPLAEANQKYFNGQSAYWQEVIDHPNYDEFWQKRSLWKHMNNVRCAVLNVGGWFDAEDPIGPFHIYHAVEKSNPGAANMIVMGPWSHGGWARGEGERLGNLQFGSKTALFFQEQIQFPFFMHHLKDVKVELPEAYMFLTGANEWRKLSAWPPKELTPKTLYLSAGGGLKTEPPVEPRAYDEYISDPNRPVPYVGYVAPGMTGDYMTEDQRFAAKRPDVLVYQTEPLAEAMTIAGPIRVGLTVSTSGTDSDFVVKVIDVYPGDYVQPGPPPTPGQRPPSNAVQMGGYQQLVHGEPFRAKFRKSFEKPEAMTPNRPAEIRFEMPDVYHTFRKGHRVMVQVQSSWFPLTDRNPQTFMEIPKAQPADFRKATQRVYRSKRQNSSITVMVQPGMRKE
ncbi:MAG: CocE/NonD family hydrolase [Blastocatellia bacterium]|nr:CocE/NonD family hydrolase [Blastocatellia bacterium]